MSDEIRYRFIEDGDFIVFEDGRIFKKLDPPVSSSGYKFVRIGPKSQPLHRVVASAFIPNPENKPQVNHIDGDKTNNAVSNLEWVTAQENCVHAYVTGLRNRQKSTEQKERLLRFRQEQAAKRAAEKAEIKKARADAKEEKERSANAKSKIRAFRKEAGLSKTELADALGLDQTTVSAWESGKAEPTLFNLRRLADILGVTPGDLF